LSVRLYFEQKRKEIEQLLPFREVAARSRADVAKGSSGECAVGKGFPRSGRNQKVLATLVVATLTFLKLHHLAWIYLEGSTPARTRLYQINISTHLEEAEQLFIIRGYINEKWEEFEKNRNYQAFLIKLK
jgi:apolipoprotein N-acyltransferase